MVDTSRGLQRRHSQSTMCTPIVVGGAQWTGACLENLKGRGGVVRLPGNAPHLLPCPPLQLIAFWLALGHTRVPITQCQVRTSPRPATLWRETATVVSIIVSPSSGRDRASLPGSLMRFSGTVAGTSIISKTDELQTTTCYVPTRLRPLQRQEQRFVCFPLRVSASPSDFHCSAQNDVKVC